MDVVGLLGATGQIGGSTAAALDERGVPFIAAGRDEGALERLHGEVEAAVGDLVVDAGDPAEVARLADRAAVVVNTVGPIGRVGATVLAATVDAGRPYVDCAVDPSHLRAAFRDRGADARRPSALVGCGALTGLGDLLTGVAAAGVGGAREVHVAYLVSDLRRAASPGLRAAVADHLGRPTLAWVDGRLREEGVGHVRRLAWFPRPVGPRNAIAIPSGEPLTVPRHLPDVRTVRSYLAVRGPTAELVQALDTLAHSPVARAWLRGRLADGAAPIASSARRAQRWACVAEVRGADDEVCRAWAYGHDLVRLTAEMLAAVAVRVLDGQVTAHGASSVAAAIAPAALLNELADVADVRWSVREPGALGVEPARDHRR